MKTRIVIGGLMVGMILQVSAQQAENDDLYFNSKDREGLKTENVTATVNDKIDADYKAFKKKNFAESEEVVTEEAVNPTDSYSARTLNPEYISRSNSAQAGEDEQNYYVEGYTLAPANTYDSYSGGSYNGYSNNYSNNLNSNYQNSWYGPSAYNSWYSPYYGSCNPYMSPYYSASPGWSMSLSYTWGDMWSPGWNYGMSYGWGSSYYNPYSYYSPYNYYGYPVYYNSGGYYSEASRPNYGKRPSRHSAVVTPTQRSYQRTATVNNNSTNGRTRQTSDEYYVKPYKRTSTVEGTSYSRDRYARPTATDFSSPTRTRESYNNNRQSQPAYSSPSRSNSSGSTPSRSSGSSSGSRPTRSRD